MDEQHAAQTEGKRLFRSREDRIVAGVCGGVAEFYGVSSLGVRVVFILLALLNGIGLIAYLIGVFLIPNAPGTPVSVDAEAKAKEFASDVQKEAEKIATKFGAPNAPGDRKDIYKTILIVLVALVLLHLLLPSYLIWIQPQLLLIIAVVLIAAHLIYRK
jgi:phage shock protein C